MSKEEPMKWYNNPERKCLGDARFTTTPTGRSSKREVAELLYLCMTCPVLAECRAEAERLNPSQRIVQGGIQWP